MTLEINLGKKREKRLMRHLKVEHPSVRGNIRVCGDKAQINRLLANVPNFERQAMMATKSRIMLKGGKK